MAETRTYNGFTYQRAAPGEPWQLVGPAQGEQPTVIRNPWKAKEEARKDEDQDIQRTQLGISQAAEARQGATLPYDVRKAAADATKAEAAAAAAVKEQSLAPKPETARIQQSIKTSALMDALNTARRQISEGWATGNFAGSGRFQGVPWAGQNSTNLAATISGIQGSIINDTLAQLKAQSANGASGYGSLTESEAQRLAAAVGALQQTQDAQSLLDNLARVEKHYRSALALSYGEDPRDPQVMQRYGLAAPEDDKDKAALPGAITPKGEVTAEGSMQPDPGLRGVNLEVERMIRAGADEAKVRGYLNTIRPGMGDQAQGIGDAIAYARQYPRDPLNIDLETVWKPAGGLSGAMGGAALYELPGGFSPGAYAIGASDLLTGGYLDNLTANPTLTRATMEGVQEKNPWSYTAGQVSGGVGAGLLGEAALARAGLTGLSQMRAGDALLGAYYGSGTADDGGIVDRVAGGGGGVIEGLLGGAAGRTLSRAGGRALSGVRDMNTRVLDSAGVPMTVGQMLGGGVKRFEDRIAGLPLVGDQIAARRREGIEGFDRAAMSEALAPIGGTVNGQIGESGVQNAHDQISAAYRSALGGSQVFPDAQFTNDLSDAARQVGDIPRVGPEVSDSIAAILSRDYVSPNGGLTGENLQPILQELRGLRSGYANDPLGNRVGEGVRSVEDALAGVFDRQAPDVMPAFNAANEAYRNQSVIDDAVLKALNQGGTFTPAQLGIASRTNTAKFGGKRAAAEGDRPFYELQRAGQEILPSEIPDSGTAGRWLIPATALGVGSGGTYAAQDADAENRAGSSAATGVIAALLAAAPYSAGARTALQRGFMAERPEIMQQIGDVMINRNRIAGLLAAPATVEYFAGQ